MASYEDWYKGTKEDPVKQLLNSLLKVCQISYNHGQVIISILASTFLIKYTVNDLYCLGHAFLFFVCYLMSILSQVHVLLVFFIQ